MDFIKLSEGFDVTIYVNPLHIIMVEPNEQTTSIMHLTHPVFIGEFGKEETGSFNIEVEHTANEVMLMLKKASMLSHKRKLAAAEQYTAGKKK